jgi:hypothetical protein
MKTKSSNNTINHQPDGYLNAQNELSDFNEIFIAQRSLLVVRLAPKKELRP